MNIKNLPVQERPRERLLRLGASALSERELLAILLRTGTMQVPVMELADQLLDIDPAGISFLAECVPEELCKLSGIGKSKACQIVAAIEVGRRIAIKPRNKTYAVESPAEAAALVMEEMRYRTRELFQIMLMNTRGHVMAIERIAEGSKNTAYINAKDVFNLALRKNASSIILIHNHPSGDPRPSEADIDVTHKLIEAGHLLGMPIIDHIIIGSGKYYSLKENNII